VNWNESEVLPVAMVSCVVVRLRAQPDVLPILIEPTVVSVRRQRDFQIFFVKMSHASIQSKCQKSLEMKGTNAELLVDNNA
jgi:hypothetical protein